MNAKCHAYFKELPRLHITFTALNKTLYILFNLNVYNYLYYNNFNSLNELDNLNLLIFILIFILFCFLFSY